MKALTQVAVLLTFSLVAPVVLADPAVNFRVVLSGDQEVPPVDTITSGTAKLHVDQGRSTIRFDVDIVDGVGILGAAGAHLHCAPAGSNGPIVVFLAGMSVPGFDGRLRFGANLNDASVINPACGADIAELVDSMLQGNVYINVHSVANPGGAIRGRIQ